MLTSDYPGLRTMSQTEAEKTPTVAGRKLSSSLKDKLKRCGRYHASPMGTSARTPAVDYQSPTVAIMTPVTQSPNHCSTESGTASAASVPRVETAETPDVGYRSGSFCTPVAARSRPNASALKVNRLKFHTPTRQTREAVDNSRHGSHAKDNSAASADPNSVKDCTDSRCSSSISILRSAGEDTTISPVDVARETTHLQQQLQDGEEELRKLRLVKMYRSKNNLVELQKLIEKWQGVTQQVLQDLLEALPDPKPSMVELLQHLQIDQELVHYDPVNEAFL